MQTQRVPIAQIEVPKVRVTQDYSEETQEVLAGTTKRLGILTPIILTKSGLIFQLVDGLHRLEQARANNETEVDAVIYDGETADNLVLNLVLNTVKGKTRASEMVAVIEELTKNHGLDSEQIAARTGLTRDYIEKLWKISQGAPSVRDALDRELIGVGAAWEICRLPTHIQQDELANMQGVYKLPIKDLRAFVDQTLKYMAEPGPTPPQRVAYTPPPPKCDGCHKETEGKYLRSIMICPSCYGKVYGAINIPPPAPAEDPPAAV